jgi:hypothetical protein
VPVDLGGAQDADEVVTGLGPTGFDHPQLELPEPEHGPQPAIGDLRRGVQVGGQHHVVGPPQQVVVVLLLEAQEVGDHQQRQPGGQVPDRVARTGLGDLVDDATAQAGDRLLQLADAPWREAPVDQRAPSLVVGVVHRDHHRQRRAVGPRRPPAGEGLGVLLDGEHVLVAGDAPHLAVLVPVHRRLPAHPGPVVEGLRGVPAAVEEVQVPVHRRGTVVGAAMAAP